MNRFPSVLAGALLAFAMPASAQWLKYPEANLPRKDGKFDVAAPTPRLPGGKPDLSGMWVVNKQDAFKYGTNMAADLAGGAPLQPWARKVLEQRMANHGRDDPSAQCLPSGVIVLYEVSPLKIVHRPDLLVTLHEINTTFRQIFLDARPFPVDPVPTYMGYSVGHWEGDTLVVESMGYNGKFWLDSEGRPATEQLRVTERFTRTSFGRMEHEITFDDPGAYTKPWTMRWQMHYVPDSGLMESYCEYNNYAEQAQEAEAALQQDKNQGKPVPAGLGN